MRKLMLPLLFIALPVAADGTTPDHYAPLAFLAGSCWKGDLPDQGKVKQTDEHCFTWLYDGRFLRDRHVVHSSDGRADYVGESTYFWDADKKTLRYLYIENQGGESEGEVDTAGGKLTFPATVYKDESGTQTYRSRWEPVTGAYDVSTEFLVKGEWKAAWKVHMVKERAATE